eukprot:235143_1
MKNDTTLLSYEDLQIKGGNDKIQLAKCIKNQCKQYLREDLDVNNISKDVLRDLTICIKHLWKWIKDIGLEAIRNNEQHFSEMNQLKLIKYCDAPQSNRWEKFFLEQETTIANLKNDNFELKNRNFELRNDLQNISHSYNSILTKYNCLKYENETILKQLNNLNHRHNKTQQKVIKLDENNNNTCKNREQYKKIKIKHCLVSFENQSCHSRDEMDILSEMCNDLLCLMKYLQIVSNNNQYEYCLNKIYSLLKNLSNLANKCQSTILQNATNALKVLTTNMCINSNIYRINNHLLYEQLKDTQNTISSFKCVSISRV